MLYYPVFGRGGYAGGDRAKALFTLVDPHKRFELSRDLYRIVKSAQMPAGSFRFRSFDYQHGAGCQSDETVSGAADDPLVKLRVAHEADNQ